MIYNFDTPIERRSTYSAKWNWFAEGVLPLWVADMDFRSPEPVIQAIKDRADHGIFGYQMDMPPLRETIVERFATRYKATITPEQVVPIPGLVLALNLITRTFANDGDGVLVQTPVYPPFLSAPGNGRKILQTAALAEIRDGQSIRYEIDWDAMEAAVTPQTKIFVLCSPHNPIGRVYTRPELERLAEFVTRHDLLLVADEIHCDLIYAPHEHVTMCSVAPELSERLITLQAPSKTFNIAGLGCGYAVVCSDQLRAKLEHATHSIGAGVSVLSLTAADAAFRYGGEWLDQVMVYLQTNRDQLANEYLPTLFPKAAMPAIEGTYLAWLDFSAYDLPGGAAKFFLDHAKVALNDGMTFGGSAYAQFVRLNYGCTADTLKQAVTRMAETLNAYQDGSLKPAALLNLTSPDDAE